MLAEARTTSHCISQNFCFFSFPPYAQQLSFHFQIGLVIGFRSRQCFVVMYHLVAFMRFPSYPVQQIKIQDP